LTGKISNFLLIIFKNTWPIDRRRGAHTGNQSKQQLQFFEPKKAKHHTTEHNSSENSHRNFLLLLFSKKNIEQSAAQPDLTEVWNRHDKQVWSSVEKIENLAMYLKKIN